MNDEISNEKLDALLKISGFHNYKGILKSSSPKIHEFFRSLLKKTEDQIGHNLELDRQIFSRESVINPIPIVEIGGTNLKVSFVNLKSDELIVEYESDVSFNNNIMTVKVMVQKITQILQSMLGIKEFTKFANIKSINEIKQIGVVLAFPISYKHYKESNFGSIITSHSKEIDVSDVIDKDLTSEFKNYWKLQIGSEIDIIIINDSIASVLCLKFINSQQNLNFDIFINVIIGTGFNISFIHEYDNKIVLVNSESGFIPIEELRGLTDFDILVNNESIVHTNFVEQMISGKYFPLLLEYILNSISETIPRFNTFEEYLNYSKLEVSAGLDGRYVQIIQKLIKHLIDRGSDIVIETLKGLVDVINEVSIIENPKIAILFEGSVLNKTNYSQVLKKKVITELDSSNRIKIFDQVQIDDSFSTIRFSSIGAAYLVSKLFVIKE